MQSHFGGLPSRVFITARRRYRSLFREEHPYPYIYIYLWRPDARSRSFLTCCDAREGTETRATKSQERGPKRPHKKQQQSFSLSLSLSLSLPFGFACVCFTVPLDTRKCRDGIATEQARVCGKKKEKGKGSSCGTRQEVQSLRVCVHRLIVGNRD